MNKRELIESLKNIKDDEEIFVAVQTNNYWMMVEAKSILDVDLKPVKYSDYLESFRLTDGDGIDTNPDKYVWVINLKR
jgi:hypothetical protein